MVAALCETICDLSERLRLAEGQAHQKWEAGRHAPSGLPATPGGL